MKLTTLEKIKSINFPTLLLFVASIFRIKSVVYSLINAFSGFFSVSFLLGFLEIICPIVLFVLLFFKENQKKVVAISSIVLGSVILFNGLSSIKFLFAHEEFMETIFDGSLFNVVASVLSGVLLLMLGIRLLINKAFTTKYYFHCGLSIFLVAYASMFLAIANPAAIITKLPEFFFVLSLWYIPKLYAEKEEERNKAKLTKKKIRGIVIVVIIMYVFLLICGAWSGTNTSHPNEPWRDLGVSEKEYMEIYNHYKYGTDFS